ncbi:MAG: hypothetical protein HC883_00445 [Bdellovibrionaceae bacterium]|nr:hypothetical protein [Pseudobdellovibrionaceae bacterium]
MDGENIIDIFLEPSAMKPFLLGFCAGALAAWFLARAYYQIHVQYRKQQMDRLQQDVDRIEKSSKLIAEMLYRFVEDQDKRGK